MQAKGPCLNHPDVSGTWVTRDGTLRCDPCYYALRDGREREQREQQVEALARILMTYGIWVESTCPDPQCGDSTWDHECNLGGTSPDYRIARAVIDAGWTKPDLTASG